MSRAARDIFREAVHEWDCVGSAGIFQVDKGEDNSSLHGKCRNPVSGLMKASRITSRLTILALSSGSNNNNNNNKMP